MGRQRDESKVFWHFAFFNGRCGIALVSALVYWLRLARLPTGGHALVWQMACECVSISCLFWAASRMLAVYRTPIAAALTQRLPTHGFDVSAMSKNLTSS